MNICPYENAWYHTYFSLYERKSTNICPQEHVFDTKSMKINDFTVFTVSFTMFGKENFNADGNMV